MRMYTTESLGRTNERHTFLVFFLDGGYFCIIYGLATSYMAQGHWGLTTGRSKSAGIRERITFFCHFLCLLGI